MAADHRRDYERRNKFHAVRELVNELLESERLGPRTRAACTEASARLWDEMLRIDRAWD
jgi:hypothetical protein